MDVSTTSVQVQGSAPRQSRAGHGNYTLSTTAHDTLLRLEVSDGDSLDTVPEFARASTMINILPKNDSASNVRTAFSYDHRSKASVPILRMQRPLFLMLSLGRCPSTNPQ